MNLITKIQSIKLFLAEAAASTKEAGAKRQSDRRRDAVEGTPVEIRTSPASRRKASGPKSTQWTRFHELIRRKKKS